ncbi:type II secretion system F family protein [Candidatus Woesearchaeota archaeon]|nr:type II secretion system F family protein [Candidatus Woesearchaeota archaeon]
MQIQVKKNLSNNLLQKEVHKSNFKLNELDKRVLNKFIRRKHKVKTERNIEEKKFSVYGSNFYAKVSNQVMGNLTFYLTNKYPDFFSKLYRDLRLANVKLFSMTYVSIILFSTLISFPILTLISLIFLSFPLSILLGFFSAIATFFVAYYYPRTLASERSKKIKYDLVFAIVHMAAIAESGAKPIAMFRLLLESKEYKYLDIELKRILNYVNLFGYSLSTALKAVANTSPSYELKELLNGVVSTIETGGDLKSYLKDKANDTLIQYRLDQEKYSARLNTYSDIYTGILIAAPLLFLVTLAILEKVSPKIGNLSIATVAAVGTYLFIPLINVLFLIFLNLTKSEL